MKKGLIALACGLALALPAEADSTWTTTDTALQLAVTTSLLVDWHQTRQIIANPAYFEYNPLIGHSPGEVNQYFAGMIVGSAVAAYVLPEPWRHRFQLGELGLELIVTGHNRSIGLKTVF